MHFIATHLQLNILQFFLHFLANVAIDVKGKVAFQSFVKNLNSCIMEIAVKTLSKLHTLCTYDSILRQVQNNGN